MLDAFIVWLGIIILEEVRYTVLGDIIVIVDVFFKFLLMLCARNLDIFGVVLAEVCCYGCLLRDINSDQNGLLG